MCHLVIYIEIHAGCSSASCHWHWHWQLRTEQGQHGIGRSRPRARIATLVLADKGGMDHCLLLLPHAGEDPDNPGRPGRARPAATPPRREPPRRLCPRRRGHRRRHELSESRHRRPPSAPLCPVVQDVREAVRVLVRERATGVRDGRGHGAGAAVVEARARHRQVVAAAAGRQALHRPRPDHGQRRHVVAPAPRGRAGVHGRQAQGPGGPHGGVRPADGARAAGGGGAGRQRGGGGRAHGEARRRHHRAHRVRHELRHGEAHLPPHRGAAAAHGALQPLPLGPWQPVFPKQIQAGNKAIERGAGAAAQGVHPAQPRDRRRGPDAVVGVRHGAPRYAAGRDGEEEEEEDQVWQRRRAGVRCPDDDRRVQDILLRRARDVGAAPHLGHHAARHEPFVAGQGARRGSERLRRRPAHRRPPPQAHRAADGDQRDAPAVPAGDAAAADGVRGHHARLRRRRAARAQGRVAVDPRAGHPPRRGRVGSGRARVQAGPVRAGARAAVGGAVPAVRVGPPQLRRPGLRHGRGQGRAGHADRELPLRHLRRVPPRARERAHAPAAPRRARAPAAVDAAVGLAVGLVCSWVFLLLHNFGTSVFYVCDFLFS